MISFPLGQFNNVIAISCLGVLLEVHKGHMTLSKAVGGLRGENEILNGICFGCTILDKFCLYPLTQILMFAPS